MDYMTLGNTGTKVSKLCFGTCRWRVHRRVGRYKSRVNAAFCALSDFQENDEFGEE